MSGSRPPSCRPCRRRCRSWPSFLRTHPATLTRASRLRSRRRQPVREEPTREHRNCAAPGANSPSTSNWPSRTSSDSRSTTTTYVSGSTPPPRSHNQRPFRGLTAAVRMPTYSRRMPDQLPATPLRHRRLRPPVPDGPVLRLPILEGHLDYVHRRLRTRMVSAASPIRNPPPRRQFW
jgi:hypothetical protein